LGGNEKENPHAGGGGRVEARGLQQKE